MPDVQQFVQNALGIFGASKASGGATQTYSSFGPENTTTGPDDLPHGQPANQQDIDPNALYFSDRSKKLGFRERYFTGRQHDDKAFDQGGRVRPPGVELWATPPMMGGMAPDFYVQLDLRRPGNPKRLGRSIVRRFTALLFGSHRFPQLRSTDPRTQSFAQELARASEMQARWSEARNMAGACGTAGISWGFYDGRLVVRPHLGRYIHCLEWEDFDRKIPRHVVELYRCDLVIPDDKGVPRKVPHWFRRDWTLTEDVVYRAARADQDGPVPWERNEEYSNVHGDGFCHFEWLPNELAFEPDDVDGNPDYAEQYEALDSLDLTWGIVAYGGQRNIDPTLVLGLDKDELKGGLSKGSDNAVAIGRPKSASGESGGTASYLEISGSSITAGLALFNQQKAEILEDCQCVVMDPDKAAAAGLSGTALELLYAPMLSVEDDHRGNYGPRYCRMMGNVLKAARKILGYAPPGGGAALPEYEVDPDGESEPEEMPVEQAELEPPAAEDESGPRKVEFTSAPLQYIEIAPEIVDGVQREREPGMGELTLQWGEYFPPSIQDKSNAAQGLASANGALPTLSHQTSVETLAALYDLDPAVEWKRVQADMRAKRAENLLMNPDVSNVDTEPASGTPAGEESLVTDTDQAAVFSVNEVRGKKGYGPLRLPNGQPDPDGNLTVAEFAAKREAKGEAVGDALGPAKPAPNPAPIPPRVV